MAFQEEKKVREGVKLLFVPDFFDFFTEEVKDKKAEDGTDKIPVGPKPIQVNQRSVGEQNGCADPARKDGSGGLK